MSAKPLSKYIMDKIIKEYEITPFGDVISKYGKEMKHQVCSNGYHRICFNINGKRYTTGVHRVVAYKYIDNPENLTDVNHRNGNKGENNRSNLEWVTRAENMRHAREVLKVKPHRKENKKFKDMVMLLLAKYKRDDVAEFVGVTPSRISAIKKELSIGNTN
jgi:hypothetical protein